MGEAWRRGWVQFCKTENLSKDLNRRGIGMRGEGWVGFLGNLDRHKMGTMPYK